jgi:23S rRNA (adenine2503-C2)-methyltransferase
MTADAKSSAVAKTPPRRPDIKSLTRDELRAQFQVWEAPQYRVDQLLAWLYDRRATGWESLSNLPKPLRERLAQTYGLGVLALVAQQGAGDRTQKFLWRLEDGHLIETVLIPAHPALYGDPSDRHTLCVSTQVGCAYGCQFCASGLQGWKRNLRAEEIVEQVLAVERWHGRRMAAPANEASGNQRQAGSADFQSAVSRISNPPTPGGAGRRSSNRLIDNLVIMGMGEPLANYEALMKALRILNASWGGKIGARKITLSTSGLAPQIRRLAEEPEQFRLALSLHGATDPVRNRLMPVNRKYPLAELMAAMEYYREKKGRMITLEFILIAGVNDALEQARLLAVIARKLHAQVNLIPYNQVEDFSWERPTEAKQEAFLKVLLDRQVMATLRREKGGDIDAACGQLRLKTERARKVTPQLSEGGAPRRPD